MELPDEVIQVGRNVYGAVLHDRKIEGDPDWRGTIAKAMFEAMAKALVEHHEGMDRAQIFLDARGRWHHIKK